MILLLVSPPAKDGRETGPSIELLGEDGGCSLAVGVAYHDVMVLIVARRRILLVDQLAAVGRPFRIVHNRTFIYEFSDLRVCRRSLTDSTEYCRSSLFNPDFLQDSEDVPSDYFRNIFIRVS